MADPDLREFYRNWLKANKPPQNENQNSENNQPKSKDNRKETPSEIQNETEKLQVESESETESNNAEDEQSQHQEPQPIQYDAPEDIIFENNQIQLYIERGNFILDIFRSYEIY